jgi:hypothetical protein
MHTIAMQFAAGKTLWVGLCLAVLACTLRYRYQRARPAAPLTVAAIAGGLLVVLSATPIPAWAYAVWSLALMAAVLSAERPRLRGGRIHRVSLAVLVLASGAIAACEVPHWRVSMLPFSRGLPVFVIGDSLAMSLETSVEPWPVQWAAKSGLRVKGLAAGGKRAQGALDDLHRIEGVEVCVLVEIGGNDVLGRTPAREFERDLRALLGDLCVPGRRVAMFELPLPPFHNAYGRIQRRYARQHGVVLIPKRCLADILADPRATVDGIHLSRVGHARMAALLASLMPEA